MDDGTRLSTSAAWRRPGLELADITQRSDDHSESVRCPSRSAEAVKCSNRRQKPHTPFELRNEIREKASG
jgi:hypothetical protein